MSTHQRIIEQKSKDLRAKGFLTIDGAHIGPFIFDLLAMEPMTKTIKIFEVDVGSATPKEKIQFAEKFSTIEIISLVPNKIEISKNLECISNALGDITRLRMMILLKDISLRWSDITRMLGLNPRKDAGKFAYHIKMLKEAKLIEAVDGGYSLTENGKKVLEVLESFI